MGAGLAIWVDHHGFAAARDDARWLAWRVLRLEWRVALASGLGRAARLLGSVRLPDLDLRPMVEPLMSGLAHQLPELLAPVGGSAQLSGALARHPVARLAPPVMLAAGALLAVVTAARLLRRRRLAGAAVLGALCLAGMAANALVIGLTAEAYDRYQARLGWLPVLALLVAAAAHQVLAARVTGLRRRRARRCRRGGDPA